MSILQIISLAQITISILLVIAILLQQRGGGLSSVFGGGESIYRTRRGMEKTIFWATIVLAILFLATAFLNILLPR